MEAEGGVRRGCAGCASAGSCAQCGGCGGVLYLTAEELAVLERFAQIPFWPLTRSGGEAVCPDEPDLRGPVLESLAFKGLIRLDDRLPLGNFTYPPDAAVRGSMALTAAGQRAAELLEIQGAEP